jgi:hypothetical protein
VFFSLQHGRRRLSNSSNNTTQHAPRGCPWAPTRVHGRAAVVLQGGTVWQRAAAGGFLASCCAVEAKCEGCLHMSMGCRAGSAPDTHAPSMNCARHPLAIQKLQHMHHNRQVSILAALPDWHRSTAAPGSCTAHARLAACRGCHAGQHMGSVHRFSAT